MKFNEYEKIILKDVTSGKYKRDKKLVKITFILISLLFLAIYFFGFHFDVVDNLKTVIASYREALITSDYSFKTLIFSFNKIMAFMTFIFLFVIFLIFAFFSYDIMSRNRLIEYFHKLASKSPQQNKISDADKTEPNI